MALSGLEGEFMVMVVASRKKRKTGVVKLAARGTNPDTPAQGKAQT